LTVDQCKLSDLHQGLREKSTYESSAASTFTDEMPSKIYLGNG